MKKFTVIECLVCLALCGSVFGAMQCQTIDLVDDEGNVTGTDVVCNETISTPVVRSLSVRDINARIRYLNQRDDELVAEKDRDLARTTAEIAKVRAEKTSLRALRTSMRAAGANITEDQLVSADQAMAIVTKNTTVMAGVNE